jgi:hypothetical protein
MNDIQKAELKFMSERDDNARVLNVWNDTLYMLPK